VVQSSGTEPAGGRGGSIVNIGSMWAHQAIGASPSSAYSAAKGGLHALTHNLARWVAGKLGHHRAGFPDH